MNDVLKYWPIVAMVFAVAGWAGNEAMQWQKDQDQRIEDLDRLLIRQQAILEIQTQINENAVRIEKYAPPEDVGYIPAPDKRN